jgi:WXG100 family type VII secretion target
MGPGSFLVTPDMLLNVAQNLQQGAGNIEETLQQLKMQVAELESAWRGGAQIQFAQVMQQWGANSSQLQQTLREIAQQLTAAANNYQQTESQNRRGFQEF